jgi:Tol biopolymer transport system component
MRPNGSKLHQLTPYGWEVAIKHDWSPDGKLIAQTKNAFAGSFSPDGRQIVFRLEQGDKAGLAVIDRDGRNLRQLTRPGSVPPRFIDWGPA